MQRIFKIIIISILVLISFYFYKSYSNTNYKADLIYNKLKQEENPSFYLNEKITYRKRVFLKGHSIYFKLENTSKFTTYENFKYKITYFSKTGKKIDSETITCYESVPPKKTISFKEITNKNIRKAYEISINLIDVDKIQNIY
ncbi:hypothetical protein [Tenacibaculum ovolyticum]|uniref:hypothetical protein n=1 Tax=Tenacibaculum ovolyticum TaxID=104270 RepID=UPI001F231310|nr:hypothetical protein [Tenacibaculum ovolyticum]